MAPVDSRDYVISGIYYSVLVRNTCQHSQQTRRWSKAGPMLAHNLRRWPSIKLARVNASCLLGCVQPSKHKTLLLCVLCGVGRGPRVVVSTAAFHARVRGLGSRFRWFKRNKNVSSPSTPKLSIVGSLRDREVACSASDLQGLKFESCVWRAVSSHSSHYLQEVLLAQFSLYGHKSCLKPDSFHFILWSVLKYFEKNKRLSVQMNRILPHKIC